MHLTKSLFVDYLTYPKLARRKLNSPQTYKTIRKINTIEAEEHIIWIGQAVEDAVKAQLEEKYHTTAVDLMPQYHKPAPTSDAADDALDDDEDDDEVLTRASASLPTILANTIAAIRRQDLLLYQPTFQHGDCLVRADMMVRNGTTYDLIEIKAKSSIRKEVTDDGEKKKIGAIKDNLMHDISFQTYVINQALATYDLPPLGSISIAYLNSEYIKHGPIDLQQLIVQEAAGHQHSIEITQRNKPTTLVIDDSLLDTATIEKTLDDMRRFLPMSEHDFNTICLRGGTNYLEYFGTDKSSAFGTIMGPGIHHSNASHIQDLYYQGRHAIADLTTDEIDGFNENGQKFIAKYLNCKTSGAPLIDEDAIRDVFCEFRYPICFYDYETMCVPVPLLDNSRPYQHTVVQYSLHKYYEDGRLEHFGGVFVGEGEYSATPITIDRDPNLTDFEHNLAITGSYQDLLQQMLTDIGDDLHRSTFLVRYEGFENSRNNEIGRLFPDLAPAFTQINDNTFDLMKIVSGGSYFDNAFKGSASIKKVMPVLAPTMDYDALTIGKGDKAARELYKLISGGIAAEERTRVIEDLLIYCGQDTMAMVRIFEEMKRRIGM